MERVFRRATMNEGGPQPVIQPHELVGLSDTELASYISASTYEFDGTSSAVREAVVRLLRRESQEQNMKQGETVAAMTEAQIKHMAERFLGWKLPTEFRPDCGISFDKIGSRDTPYEFVREPIGTNLFGYSQALAMVRHMIEGLPSANTNES